MSTRIAAARALRELEDLKAHFGDRTAARKLLLLRVVIDAALASAKQVLRLHEVLCFLRAHPDDEGVLAEVERALAHFAQRRDLIRFRRALADSGIAGTDIHYTFYAPTARWLAERWGEALSVDWRSFTGQRRLENLLPLLVSYAETPGLDEVVMSVRQWVNRLKGPQETDARFLVRRLTRIGADEFAQEALYDELDLTLTLAAGATTPSRTHAKLPRPWIHYQAQALRRARPDIRHELSLPPVAVRNLDVREGARVVALARESMVTRSRDLDAFSYGDARDVRIVDCGSGLEFACIGVIPQRRLLLESVYAFLTLMNGVPIGYVLASALHRSSEIAYNVFDTWRGGEAAHVYGRVLATMHHLFGSDSFTVFPYQLGGSGNTEGLKSGAWWFYQKLGFRARDPDVLALMQRELTAMRRNPRHRSSAATLKLLSQENVYWHKGARRDDVIGIFPAAEVGLAISDFLARRFGSEREQGERVCADEAGALLGLADWRRLVPGERVAWIRWSPLVLCLPRVDRWSEADKRALVDVIRKKGGRRESDFVHAFDAHRLLRSALRRLAARGLR
ncbi:MAG: hypothetical protein IT521_09850 [Burkholderiales bacterium]|nr:hypothetical protein [Burkholderiales bacterium]